MFCGRSRISPGSGKVKHSLSRPGSSPKSGLHAKMARFTSFSPATLKKPQKQCWEARNIVLGLPTMLGDSQHCILDSQQCCGAPNIVGRPGTLFFCSQHCFWEWEHCFLLRIIVSRKKSPGRRDEALFQEETRSKNRRLGEGAAA